MRLRMMDAPSSTTKIGVADARPLDRTVFASIATHDMGCEARPNSHFPQLDLHPLDLGSRLCEQSSLFCQS